MIGKRKVSEKRENYFALVCPPERHHWHAVDTLKRKRKRPQSGKVLPHTVDSLQQPQPEYLKGSCAVELLKIFSSVRRRRVMMMSLKMKGRL